MKFPWLIVWILDGQLYTSKHESRDAALNWAKANEFQNQPPDHEFAFDITDTHVFINGPDQLMEELTIDDLIVP
jgi:hypothetical protein